METDHAHFQGFYVRKLPGLSKISNGFAELRLRTKVMTSHLPCI